MSFSDNLTLPGLLAVGVGSAFITSVGTHPLGILKDHYIAHRSFPSMRDLFGEARSNSACQHGAVAHRSLRVLRGVRGLYVGFVAYAIADILSTTLTYTATHYLESSRLKDYSFLPSAVGGAISVTVMAPGEGIKLNRQLHGMSMRDAVLNATTKSGFLATMLREIPYSVGLLGGASEIEKTLPFENQRVRRFTAGVISGLFVGLATGFQDIAKTIVQKDRCSLFQAYRSIYRNGMMPGGRQQLLIMVALRVIYIGMALGIQHTANYELAERMPEAFKRIQE